MNDADPERSLIRGSVDWLFDSIPVIARRTADHSCDDGLLVVVRDTLFTKPSHNDGVQNL